MSAEAFKAVMQAEMAGMRMTFADHFMDGLEDHAALRRSFYWWQRLAMRLGIFV